MESLTNTTTIDEKVGENGHSSQNVNHTERGPIGSALTKEMLSRFASRAANYARENRFFEEDFEELRAAIYLLLPCP